MNDKTAAEAAHVRRVVAKIRRALSESSDGVPRATLRRRLASRDKHLYDAALDLLVSVGDVAVGPARSGTGTRYSLTDAGQPTVGPASDEETHPEEVGL